jgi:hypothetical protein
MIVQLDLEQNIKKVLLVSSGVNWTWSIRGKITQHAHMCAHNTCNIHTCMCTHNTFHPQLETCAHNTCNIHTCMCTHNTFHPQLETCKQCILFQSITLCVYTVTQHSVCIIPSHAFSSYITRIPII